jgi:hypothetical protein
MAHAKDKDYADRSDHKPELVTTEGIGRAITGLLARNDAEFEEMTEADLEKRWHFAFDPALSIEHNMYVFHDRLALYAYSCRR